MEKSNRGFKTEKKIKIIYKGLASYVLRLASINIFF